MVDLSVYVPYYSGLDAYPAHYAKGTNQADSESLYWKYRKLRTLVMTDYPKLAPIVKKAYAEWEAKTEQAQRAFEAEYLKTYKSNKAAAHKMLNRFNLKTMASREAHVRIARRLRSVGLMDAALRPFFKPDV